MEQKHTIVETQPYIKQAERIGLSPTEMAAIKLYLAENPTAGDIIKGSGGVRKVRFSRPGTGKSGGVRLFTFYWTIDEPLFLLWVIAKTQQANVSPQFVNALHDVVKELKNG
ncbi:type II toxin-antitoxin system RelE/ParE family toxin [Novosphingobium clariflavum]|uniref:Type II toxin-antitoxin system RelE/ParE family toxin n=1 Tax=Novosphingobium clariflavum TaxID=2029884 RepID=A0ABV6S5N2_9SPHN|nr:type II toxin-antitoxin system RelE/ParE family toxin [Novosphingobium clariflavum]